MQPIVRGKNMTYSLHLQITQLQVEFLDAKQSQSGQCTYTIDFWYVHTGEIISRLPVWPSFMISYCVLIVNLPWAPHPLAPCAATIPLSTLETNLVSLTLQPSFNQTLFTLSLSGTALLQSWESDIPALVK